MKREPRGHASEGSGRLAGLKAQLAARGLRPRKSLGQNFLIDANFAAAVAREAEADERTLLLEVGPGTGFLTQALLETCPSSRVIAIELDRGLAGLLRDRFVEDLDTGRLTLLEGDALAGKHRLNAEWLAEADRLAREQSRTRWVLCANLAYNMATPLIANLLVGARAFCPARPPGVGSPPASSESPARSLPLRTDHGAAGTAALRSPRLVQRIVATVQLELAERLVGRPGTRDYGPLAALAALTASCRIVRKVGPEVFWPRPQVQSAVLRIDLPPWSETALPPEGAQGFLAFLHQVFGQRRKTLRAALKGTLPTDHPLSGARAEDVKPADLLGLFQELHA